MAKKRTRSVDNATALAIVEETLPLATVEPKQLRAPVFMGRGNPAPHSMQKLAREYTEDAFATILEIMDDDTAEPSTRLEAAKVVLDRGWGKAAVNIKAETIKYTLSDLQSSLLANKDYVDAKIEDARRLESERLGQYIAADAEVIEDVTARGAGALQDHAQGSGDKFTRLHADSVADAVSAGTVIGEEIYGSSGNS